jgi:hypothetical protein
LYSQELYREENHHYKEIPSFQSSAILYGYFQSPQYFVNEYNAIIEKIGLRKQQEEIGEKYKSVYFNTERPIISCHFRRGDYIKYPQQHPILPVTYYKKAFSMLDTSIQYRVLYFCEVDDKGIIMIEYIEPLKKKYPSFEFVWVDSQAADWEQMLIMSLCSIFVIANSSFSWWGAYFSNITGKRVLYPALWFGPALKGHNLKDLFPDSWERIEF